MIATHSVIADVTAGVLWVSRGPHQLGVYDPYRIEGFGGEVDVEPIPADPILEAGGYERLCRARELLRATADLTGVAEEPDLERMERLLQDALALNPKDPDALFLLGLCLASAGRKHEALRVLAEAEEAFPPFQPLREGIEDARRRLEAELVGAEVASGGVE
jgi:thioredoxin-like negative regulator of GroEL